MRLQDRPKALKAQEQRIPLTDRAWESSDQQLCKPILDLSELDTRPERPSGNRYGNDALSNTASSTASQTSKLELQAFHGLADRRAVGYKQPAL